MKYMNLEGTPVEGELWAPGPKMGSVWVFSAAGPVVVDTKSMTEVGYRAPDLGKPHTDGDVAAARRVLADCPASGWPRKFEPRDDFEARAVAHAQRVIGEREVFDQDWFNRQQRRQQRAPLSKRNWAAFVEEQLGDFTVEEPALFATAA
ncbi:hypothetical protein [Prescottella agglutinans]|uniref:Uncharacterized protein n=1 Tax=Prescottella agglutinans TaxID=1644129 RepID=A0ABT6MI05_9NOCA|nr:hypothetical protein [Prescottella agglutinans]MDH6283962.1 hypothetical protein [Prescottella agglutinans]